MLELSEEVCLIYTTKENVKVLEANGGPTKH